MKSYKELMEEKTRIRTSHPEIYSCYTMLLDGAYKLAKSKGCEEVTDKHITESARIQVSSIEKAIDLIKSKGGDTTKQEAEVALYKAFLPKMISEEETRDLVMSLVNKLPTEERKPQNMGKVMQAFKAAACFVDDKDCEFDMKLVSSLFKEHLK